MIRNKMTISRKKFQFQPVKEDLRLTEVRMRTKTLKGERIIHASRLENKEVQVEDDKVIVGADVEGLYPALKDMEVADICYKAILNSSISSNNINYHRASIYVAMNLTSEEARIHPLGRVLPKRNHETGSRPWVTGDFKKAELAWSIPQVEWTKLEERLMLAEMTRIGVIVMMNSHLFRWDGKIFLQRQGGPIGLRSTCAVARITMMHWDGKLAEFMDVNNIRLEMGARYMDDVRLILDSIHEGWRWDRGGLYFSEGWKLEDEKSGETSTQRTARVPRDMMNDVLKFLNLTIEIGDDFDDGKLPTLDLKIWIQLVGNCRIVVFEYYEKPMKTNLVLQSHSAISENTKVSSLSQEVVRLLKNCSEDIDNKYRMGHLEKFCGTKNKKAKCPVPP